MRTNRPRTAAALALTAMACAHHAPKPVVAAAPLPPPGPKMVERTLADVGLDITAMDRTADPCQDFFQYACGNWLKKTEIPEDRSLWSRSFSEIDKRNEDTLHDILEAARRSQNADPVTAKIGAFYNSCMDEEGIEKNGINPIRAYLKIARKAHDRRSVLDAIIQLHKYRFPVLFDISASQDGKDATKMIASLDQNGLGLPDRDYYLADDDNSRDIREFYVNHIEKMMTLAGEKPRQAKKIAKDVMLLETEIAKISKTRVERRDPQGVYNKIDLAGLKQDAPDFPWDEYLMTLDHPSITEINVTSVPFFKGLNDLLASTKPAIWQSYLAWTVVRDTASALPKAFVDEDFALTQKLTGQKKIRDRWKRCVEATDGALGELLGQPFVKEKFAGDSKTAMEKMVGEIRDAFGHDLTGLDWMDDATRAKAQDKLAAVSFLIGYPDKWKEYDYTIDPENFAANVLASRAYELQRDLNKVGKPVDRGEWDMSPPTVNAYYNPQKNQMVFPAGILQSPFFSASSSVPVNMGGIGMVVGHELTHGFDDEGSQFDAQGNLLNWWAPAVNDKFKAKGQCIADQYGGYSPLPGVTLNGKLTEGENIADNGGMKLAFEAYRHMRADAPERIVADGFTEDQQFFLAIGQAWCANVREAAIRMRAKVDPHSPPRFRVNGPLSNLPAFGEAFECKLGTPMNPEKKCHVW